MTLPADHPLRTELSEEVHARPPEALGAPSRVSLMALLGVDRHAERAWLAELAASCGVPSPPAGAIHFGAELGGFRLKWERHTEFSRFMFIVEGAVADPFVETAVDAVPAGFMAPLGGEAIAAAHVALLTGDAEAADLDAMSARYFAGNPLVGAEVSGRAAIALTDFRIHADRFSRFVVLDRGLTPRQAGRLVQRLLEIEVYKTMALLAFPEARALVPFLGGAERELAAVTTSLASGERKAEASLLERLTRLEAQIESRGAENHFRFGASAAYDELVRRRIAELREVRIPGLQTFGEFIERRLVPAMNTCRSTSSRQEALSRRVARANQLLSTQVDVMQSEQTREVLSSMDRRAQLQLRLQQTVEGLSIVAITYYAVGLVGYAAKGTAPLGLKLDPDLVMALSIPLVLVLAAVGIRSIRRRVAGRDVD